jgi:hypothetical protein
LNDMDDRKTGYVDERKKECMDKKKKMDLYERRNEHMRDLKKGRRMMGFRPEEESHEASEHGRSESAHAYHHAHHRFQQRYGDRRSDCGPTDHSGPRNRGIGQRPHWHYDYGKRPTHSILREKQHLERLVYALQCRLRKINRQLRGRMEDHCGAKMGYDYREASRY